MLIAAGLREDDAMQVRRSFAIYSPADILHTAAISALIVPSREAAFSFIEIKINDLKAKWSPRRFQFTTQRRKNAAIPQTLSCAK